MGKRGIRYVINDSWEAGSQNWTDNMIAQFQKLRGYDPTPWLPVLAGRVVESSAASDRFLWDFRKTIADLIANEHYGAVGGSSHERGMGHYGESHESGQSIRGRRHGSEEIQRNAHERDVDANAGREQGAVRIQCG